MSLVLAKKLRRIAFDLQALDNKISMLKAINADYGIKVDPSSEYELVERLYSSLKRLPPDLVKDCGITVLGFQDLGPSKEFFPNHGKYMDGALILNTQLVDDPFLEVDFETGNGINRLDHTLYHELGHGWDEAQGPDKELCLQPDWMDLSKWSKDPQEGLKRIIINEPGTPELRGEYCYSPEANFVRFYAKRNPWDDWADSFSYYVGGLKNHVPEEKRTYFDDRLAKYY